MKISGVNNMTANKSNISFGIGIYGTKGANDLLEYYKKSGMSEKLINKFLGDIMEIRKNENISIRIKSMEKLEQDFLPKINYILSGSILSRKGNSHYVRMNGQSSVAISDIKENIMNGLKVLQEKSDRFERKPNFISRLFSRMFKKKA